MNIVHLSGAFTRDPELKEISTGDRTTKVVNFVLASSRRFRKKDGTSDEETTFVNCEAWDSGADTIAKWFSKGDQIIINGSLKNERWEDKEGNDRYTTQIVANEMQMLGSRDDNSSNQGYAPPASDETPAKEKKQSASVESPMDDIDDDIPF